MGGAIVRGVVRAGLLPAAAIAAVDSDASKLAALATLGVAATTDLAAAIAAARPDAAVLVAVKPQSFAVLAGVLASSRWSRQGPVVSIMAGLSTTAIAAAINGPDGASSGGAGGVRVIRVMPNLPVSVGMGMSALCSGNRATSEDLALAERIIATLGRTIRIEERLMDAFTALAGSGPAYLFYLAQAMRNAGESLGFDATTADAVVRATLRGSAELLATSPATSAEALRAGVTSQGGTTAAATAVLDEAGVIDSFLRAITAARDRSVELAALAAPSAPR